MNEQLHQHLMEFVYGLLDEGESNALCERITSDPQVAREYAKVKLQCDLVARAALVEAPKVAWIRPEHESPKASPQAAATAWSASGYRRLANWCLAVAASGLICLVGSSYLFSARFRPAQVVLTGPSKLHGEASNPFTIQVETQAGTPVSTTLNYRVYDTSGAVTWQDAASTDASGIARFDVEPAIARQASYLEITAADDSPTPIQWGLETAPQQLVTYLRMDRPLYQPGEKVQYRSVTLSRFGLHSEHEVKTSFEIVNANDEQLAGTTTVATKDGVGWGEFVLPTDLSDGTYTLIARSPDNLFREEWRDFHVRRYEAPRLRKKLELAQDSYTAGDQVELDFSVAGMAGKPLADAPLQIQATVDGVSLDTPQAKTGAEGKSRFALQLPESIERGEASVSVLVREGDDPPETITKEIPINLGKVNVDFYPEGGDLAAGLPNRVYFYGRDPLGKPTHIEGHIVDSNGGKIAAVVTGHEGRGVFSLTPAADERYRLILEKPVGVTKEIPLPSTSPIRFATIETGAGAFGANAPIAFTLHQRNPVEPLIVAAYCRGAMVGQQTIEPDAYTVDQADFATFRGELDLPPQVQGVVRLTVFDANPTPPEPIAERLVYRRVGQKLDVRLKTDAETFRPKQSVQLDVEVRDENDAPVPAVLGIAIVDDAILNLADDKSTRMPTYFQLLTEIDSAEQLEDANFYLSDKPESVAALDSLLGTQGWRRFQDLPSTQLAQAGGGGFGGGGVRLSFRNDNRSERFRSLAWYDAPVIPLSTATTMDVRKISLSRFTRAAKAASWNRESLAFPIIIVSVVLLVLVGVASLRGAYSNRSLRMFAGVIAVVSLVVGIVSLPAKPIRVDRAAGSASPAAVDVAMLSDEQETETLAEDAVAIIEEADAEKTEGYFGQADNKRALSEADDMPKDAAPMEPKLAQQLEAAPKPAPEAASRFAQSADVTRRQAEPSSDDKAKELLRKEEKKTAMLSRDAQLPSPASASPEKPQPTPGAPSGKPLAAQLQGFTDGATSELLTREYAKWFYEAPAIVAPSEMFWPTSFWQPHHSADATGKATVYFNLPQRPASFRAIVEAHGGGRLGTGELLIESR